jgi:hypothetical protein
VNFDEIIAKALGEADAIDCPVSEYIDALEGWLEEIQLSIDAARESADDGDAEDPL